MAHLWGMQHRAAGKTCVGFAIPEKWFLNTYKPVIVCNNYFY
jgi:hypothetical protein